jgi:hypothetical protein
MFSVRVTPGRALLVAAFAAIGLLAAAPVDAANPYLNSSEPGCNGSDPNVLLCDDFETTADGAIWYSNGTSQSPISCDAASSLSGGLLAHNKGWCGKGGSPVSPPGGGVCGGVGAGGTNCTASHGPQSGGTGGENHADHTLLNEQGVSTIYVRWYQWFSPGFQAGWEKMLTFNQPGLNTAGIFFGHLKIRGAQSGTRPTTWDIDYEISNNVEDGHRAYNISPLSYTGGSWYFFEVRITLESTGGTAKNGTLEIWSNNCGSNGLGCTGMPTLRAQHTNVHFRTAGTGAEQIGDLWWENWGNLGSVGESRIDQIKVSKVGPIGFMGSAAATADRVAPGVPGTPVLR